MLIYKKKVKTLRETEFFLENSVSVTLLLNRRKVVK